MGIFGNSSPFDQDIEKVTSENNTTEDWGAILEICDRAAAGGATSARECLRATLRRLGHADPHVQVQAATLLNACVANCGRPFLLEVASREFEHEFRRLVARAQPAVAARLRAMLRKWAAGEFRDDPQLDLVVALHRQLADDAGAPSPPSGPPAPSAHSAGAAAADDEELARAIALSLREAGPPGAGAAPLYPRVDADPTPPAAPAAAPPAPRKVRALYDFEAAEDNELTFLAGEIVVVTDSSDPNWWKGHNARGEGLFPANFVSADLSVPQPQPQQQHQPQQQQPQSQQQQQQGAYGAAEAEVEGEGEGESLEEDGLALDAALALLLEADPERADEQQEAALGAAEARVARAGARVDAALERADRRHARLTQLSAELVRALNLYHDLMRDPYVGVTAVGGTQRPPHQQQQYALHPALPQYLPQPQQYVQPPHQHQQQHPQQHQHQLPPRC